MDSSALEALSGPLGALEQQRFDNMSTQDISQQDDLDLLERLEAYMRKIDMPELAEAAHNRRSWLSQAEGTDSGAPPGQSAVPSEADADWQDDLKRADNNLRTAHSSHLRRHQPVRGTLTSTREVVPTMPDDQDDQCRPLTWTETRAWATQERIKGNEAYKVKDYKQALDKYNCALELDASDAEAFGNRAAVYSQLKEWTKAEADCSQALCLRPEYNKVRIRRASANMQLNNPAAALEDAMVVTSSKPGHKEALRLEERARQLLEQTTTRLVVEETDLPDTPTAALSGSFCSGAEEPGTTSAPECKENVLAQQVSDDEELPEADESEDGAKQPASSTGKAASLLMAAGNFQKASHTLAEALRTGASSAAMHLQLAQCHLALENYESALRLQKL
ncbi:hypothetical protein WJX84_003344 [Apatococcus fuscideae]|uniref:Uncharacterized protein n=1 Tax=Apatococcus fuscideae TaxID=2026836 RepID=A0AAW1S0Z1_9CHLO